MSRHKKNPENPANIDLSSTLGNLLEEDATGKEVFRSQQSLGLITQRFMSLRTKNEVMNLNAVARELAIPKRRVYDVINVLEGLGYVQKIEKNNIQWIGEAARSDEQDHLEATVENLRQQEKILECMIKDAEAILQLHFEDPIARPYNYVKKEDIRKTTDSNSKLIIIKSDNDTDNKFDVEIADSVENAGHDVIDVIVRNINQVKSHALLFDNARSVVVKEEEEEQQEEQEVPTGNPSKEVKLEAVDSDPDDMEGFLLPSSSTMNQPYVPETPGRGLFFSPFKSMIDPCILPCVSDDLIHIMTPSSSAPQLLQHEEPVSILDFFNDE